VTTLVTTVVGREAELLLLGGCHHGGMGVGLSTGRVVRVRRVVVLGTAQG